MLFFFSYLQEPLKLHCRAGTDRLDLTMATVFIKKCLSVPAVMLRLCFCNFSSFQLSTGVVRQEAIGRQFRGVFRLNLINHDRVTHCCKKQSKTKNEKHPVSLFCGSFASGPSVSVAPSRGPEEVGASSTLTSLSRR